MQHQDPARNRAGLLLGILAMVVVVASVIGTLAAAGRFASHKAGGSGAGVLTGLERIDTVRSADLYCPSFPSFSSDGTRFAVLGTGIPCTDPAAVLPGNGNHKLAIYDVHTELLQRVVELDRFFLLNSIQDCPAWEARALQFTSLGWSPDGEHFAVLYAAYDSASYTTANPLSPDDLVCSGLLLLAVDSNSAVAISAVAISGDAGFFDSATGAYAGYPTWDVQHLTSYLADAIPPSLVYGWSEAGGQPKSYWSLTGATLNKLPLNAGPGYPVGNPSRDSVYSLWQPGIVAGPQVFSGGAAPANDDDVFVTQFPTWLPPNGQYVTMLVAGVELPPADRQVQPSVVPTPSPTAVPIVLLPPELTQVPARDPALVAIQQQIGAAGWAMVGWNEEGTILASISCGADPALQLRATESGTLIGSMPLRLEPYDHGCSIFNFNQALGSYPNPNLSLQWSPDGSHVLLADQTADMVTLWQVASTAP